MSKCTCEDSYGVVCGKEMTLEEEKQDGMCDSCACHVWTYFNDKGDTEHTWSNSNKLGEGVSVA